MAVTYKISSKNPGGDRLDVRRVISHLQTGCGSVGTYLIGDQSASMGWTFFDLALDDAFESAIAAKFADMIAKYSGKDYEKFDAFMSDYASARGCELKIERKD